MQEIDGVRINLVKNNKFKTNMIGVFFSTELKEETATVNALVPAVLRRGCNRYNTMKDIAIRLETLYGAKFDCGVSKKGDKQVLSFWGEVIDKDYVQEEENIFRELANLIKQIILEPLFIGGRFKKEYVEQEKNKLKNIIESRKNDKVQYALERCYELMYQGTPLGISEYGEIEKIDGITEEDIVKAYKKMINNFQVDIIISGDIDESEIEKVANVFNFDKRKQEDIDEQKDILENAAEPQEKRFEESFEINQAKLSLTYRTEIKANSEDYFKILVFNGILGGGVQSKMFQNVREKLGLAYYAFSRYDKFQGTIGISSGIEQENYQKVLDTILQQIEDIKKGNISETEYNTTIITIVNALNSMKDEQSQLLDFYYGQNLIGSEMRLEDIVENVKKIKVEDVIKVSGSVKLDTIYFMKGNK